MNRLKRNLFYHENPIDCYGAVLGTIQPIRGIGKMQEKTMLFLWSMPLK
jgi:hypothetical protein